MPLDEQNKGMLYTALRLRLSLVRRTCTYTLTVEYYQPELINKI